MSLVHIEANEKMVLIEYYCVIARVYWYNIDADGDVLTFTENVVYIWDNVIHSVGVRKIYVTASMQMKFRMCLYECQMTLNYNVLQKWWYTFTRHWNIENNVNNIIEDCFLCNCDVEWGLKSWGIFEQFMTSGGTFSESSNV